jgi:DNA repair exonuclease SbcCD ATPase subunit
MDQRELLRIGQAGRMGFRIRAGKVPWSLKNESMLTAKGKAVETTVHVRSGQVALLSDPRTYAFCCFLIGDGPEEPAPIILARDLSPDSAKLHRRKLTVNNLDYLEALVRERNFELSQAQEKIKMSSEAQSIVEAKLKKTEDELKKKESEIVELSKLQPRITELAAEVERVRQERDASLAARAQEAAVMEKERTTRGALEHEMVELKEEKEALLARIRILEGEVEAARAAAARRQSATEHAIALRASLPMVQQLLPPFFYDKLVTMINFLTQ